MHINANTAQGFPSFFGRDQKSQSFVWIPVLLNKLAGIRTRARNEAWAQGAIAQLRVGCSKRAQNPGVTQEGWSTTQGLPIPGPSNASFPDTHTNSQNLSLPPSRAPVASTVRRRYRRHRSEERERRLSVPAPSPGKTTTRSRCAHGSRERALR